MLLRLMPEQAAEQWDVIKGSIRNAPPPTTEMTPERMNNILEGLLIGSITCWISYKRTDDGPIPEAAILTTVTKEPISGMRSLLIYLAHGFRKPEGRTWTEGFDALRKHAKSVGCSRIIAYSNFSVLAKIVEKLGGDASYKMLILPV